MVSVEKPLNQTAANPWALSLRCAKRGYLGADELLMH